MPSFGRTLKVSEPRLVWPGNSASVSFISKNLIFPASLVLWYGRFIWPNKMKLSVIKPSSYAAASLSIGIVIILTILAAILAYKTEAIKQLTAQNMVIALLTSLIFFVYIICILAGSFLGIILSIVSFIRKEGKNSASLSGLLLNATVIILFCVKFFGLIWKLSAFISRSRRQKIKICAKNVMR